MATPRMTPERFWQQVEKTESGCWLWRGSSWGSNGYGRTWHLRKAYLAHRRPYELAKGEIPAGLVVRHTCDVRLCVNPDHLLLGTQRDNDRDAVERGRKAVGTRNGFAKLEPLKVQRIRGLAAAGMPQRQIAKEFGVAQATVGLVVRKETWKVEK